MWRGRYEDGILSGVASPRCCHHRRLQPPPLNPTQRSTGSPNDSKSHRRCSREMFMPVIASTSEEAC